jgi:hypothetical protein
MAHISGPRVSIDICSNTAQAGVIRLSLLDCVYMVDSPSTQPNPRYWLTDGTIIACIEQNLYKINDSIPLTKLNSLPTTDISGYQCVQFPDDWQVTSKDFEALLEHVQGTTYVCSPMLCI